MTPCNKCGENDSFKNEQCYLCQVEYCYRCGKKCANQNCSDCACVDNIFKGCVFVAILSYFLWNFFMNST